MEKVDYVIIGTGTAGGILAVKLAKKGYSVLSLEAGSRLTDNPNVLYPLGYLGFYNGEDSNLMPFHDPKFTWQTFSEPDSGDYGTIALFPNGRMWGGSSGHNFMLYVNGGSTVYNQDFPLGWKANDIYPYLNQVQATIRPFRSSTKANVSRVYLQALRNIRAVQIIEGGTNWLTNVETGTNLNNIEDPDPNAPQVSYLLPQNNVVAFSNYFYFTNELPDGTFIRKFVGNAYLGEDKVDPFTGRGIGKYKTLQIVSYANALKILFKNKDGNPKAVGVQYLDYCGHVHKVCARKEVILSAGAVETPSILQRSGLGDYSELFQACRKDSPKRCLNPITQAPPGELTYSTTDDPVQMVVPKLILNNPGIGANFKNDVGQTIPFEVTGPDTAAFMQTIYIPTPETIGFFGGGFFNYHPLDPTKPTNWQEVSYRKYQQIIIGSPRLLDAQVAATYNINQNATNIFLTLTNDERFASRGTVEAAVPNLPSTPEISFNTIIQPTAPTGVPPPEALVQALSTSEQAIGAILAFDINYQIAVAMNTAAIELGFDVNVNIILPPMAILAALNAGLNTYGVTWWYYLFPDINPLPPDPAFSALLQEIIFYARVLLLRQSHQQGTAQMDVVVDRKLKAVAVDKLRIIDASVLTFLPGGNPCATIMAFALKGADLILGENNV